MTLDDFIAIWRSGELIWTPQDLAGWFSQLLEAYDKRGDAIAELQGEREDPNIVPAHEDGTLMMIHDAEGNSYPLMGDTFNPGGLRD